MVKPQIKWTEENIKFLKDNYPKYGYKCISEKLNITSGAVKQAAIRWKLKSEVDKNSYKLKTLTEETNINYYWLGFIMADGYISESGELKIVLSIKDKDHLQKLADLLKVNLRTLKNKQGKEYCTITCKDVKYGVILKDKMNISNNKTYNAPNLEFLDNKNKFLSFFAGFVDGDGCIVYRKETPYLLRIMCHFNWLVNLEFFSKQLEKYTEISTKTSITNRGYSCLTLTLSEKIRDLKTKFTKLNLPIMERKWTI